MKIACLTLALALSACASLDPQQFAASSNKDANVSCVHYDSLPVDVGVLNMNIDKGVVENGELHVVCGQNSVKFTNKGK